MHKGRRRKPDYEAILVIEAGGHGVLNQGGGCGGHNMVRFSIYFESRAKELCWRAGNKLYQ